MASYRNANGQELTNWEAGKTENTHTLSPVVAISQS